MLYLFYLLETVRGYSDGHARRLAQSMRDYGWEEDSILLVTPASKELKTQENNEELVEIQDGNTRGNGVKMVDSIDEVLVELFTWNLVNKI